MTGHDGCDGCRFLELESGQEPCVRCKYNYVDKYERGQEEKAKVVHCYGPKDGPYPGRILVEFEEGNTAVYHLHVEQPKPVFVEIRSRQGYVNQPMRRRRRK